MIPKDGYYTEGSTYDHGNLSFHPQKEWIISLRRHLGKGFGSKGVFVMPYSAIQFADFLEGESKIEEKENVQRVC